MPDGGEIPFDDAIGRYCAGLEKKSMTTAELDALVEKFKQIGEGQFSVDGWSTRLGNYYPAILAALQQAKVDREEVERMLLANYALSSHNQDLRDENERLAKGLEPILAASADEAEPPYDQEWDSVNGWIHDWVGIPRKLLDEARTLFAARPAAAKEEPDRTPMICTVCGEKYIGRGNHACSRAAKEGTK